MAGAPRARSLNIAVPEAEARPVLVPGGNKARSGPANARKPSPKPVRKAEPAPAGTPEETVPAATKAEEGAKRNAVGGGGGGAPKGASPVPSPRRTPPGPPSRRNDAPLSHPGLPLSASCSSDASAESVRARRVFTRKVEKVRSVPTAQPKQGKAVGKAAESKPIRVKVVAPMTVTPEVVAPAVTAVLVSSSRACPILGASSLSPSPPLLPLPDSSPLPPSDGDLPRITSQSFDSDDFGDATADGATPSAPPPQGMT